MKCYLCNSHHLLGESCQTDNSFNTLPRFDPVKYNLDPIIPKYEPPAYDPPQLYNFDPVIPKYEPLSYDPPNYNLDPIIPKYELPLLPPPMPVRDIGNNMIGYRDSMSNDIKPINNMINGGMPLHIEGNFVRDTFGNLYGQMGPGNTMFPPPSFGPPDFDPGF